jgi:hypothetical protein
MSTPRQEIARFQHSVVQAVKDYIELVTAVAANGRAVAMSTALSEQLARQLTLDWETFMHRLLMTRAHVNAAHLLSDLGSRVKASVNSKFGVDIAARVTFDLTPPATAAEVEGLLDAKGFNVTFKTPDELAQWATTNLAPADAIKHALNPADREFFLFMVALRDYLSHKSASSLDRLKVAANLRNAANRDFSVVPTDVVPADVYLRSEPPSNPTMPRVICIARRIHQISFSLL